MPLPRENPYIWVTWLAKLLAGESSCEWSAWFRAHYQDWAKPPSDFNQAQWMLDHTALVNQARESREKLGYKYSRRTRTASGSGGGPRPWQGSRT